MVLEVSDSDISEQVEIRMIRPSQFAVRSELLEKELQSGIKELAASIQQHGLLQPLLVRPVERAFEIVAGHRRFSACKSLRWRYIPCRIKELSDKDAFEIQLVENIQRNALDPVEEAEAFSRYVLEYGWGGVSELARRIGKSEEYVSHRLQLLKLPEEVKEEISRRRLTVSHAMEIASLEPPEQTKVANAIIQNNLSVQTIRELKKFTREGQSLEEILESANVADKTLNASVKRARVLKKTLLSLKLTLFRIDSLIEEVNNCFEPSERVTILNVLMCVRLKVHNLIDDVIRAKQNVKKEVGSDRPDVCQ